MSSVNALARRTRVVHDFDDMCDTPGRRRTDSRSASEYWRSRASWYLDVATLGVVVSAIVLVLVLLFPLPLPVALPVGVCCVACSVVVAVWCGRNYSAAMDFAAWSLEAGNER